MLNSIDTRLPSIVLERPNRPDQGRIYKIADSKFSLDLVNANKMKKQPRTFIRSVLERVNIVIDKDLI
jgi:hypothetical protein